MGLYGADLGICNWNAGAGNLQRCEVPEYGVIGSPPLAQHGQKHYNSFELWNPGQTLIPKAWEASSGELRVQRTWLKGSSETQSCVELYSADMSGTLPARLAVKKKTLCSEKRGRSQTLTGSIFWYLPVLEVNSLNLDVCIKPKVKIELVLSPDRESGYPQLSWGAGSQVFQMAEDMNPIFALGLPGQGRGGREIQRHALRRLQHSSPPASKELDQAKATKT